jgi:hypothetical protein
MIETSLKVEFPVTYSMFSEMEKPNKKARKRWLSGFSLIVSARFKSSDDTSEIKWGHRAMLAPSYLGTIFAVCGLNF